MRLDGDAALALQVHRIEELVLLVAVGDGAGAFQQPVRKRGLAVIDVGNDAEIAGELGVKHRRPGTMSGTRGIVNPSAGVRHRRRRPTAIRPPVSGREQPRDFHADFRQDRRAGGLPFLKNGDRAVSLVVEFA